MEERRLGLGQELAETLAFLPDVGNTVRDQREPHAHRALNQVGEREVADRPVRGSPEFVEEVEIWERHADDGVAVGVHGRLRLTAGPRREGDHRQVVRPESADASCDEARLASEPGSPRLLEFPERHDPLVVVLEERAVVDDHDPLHAPPRFAGQQELVEVLLILRHEEPGVGLIELVADLLG